MTKINIITKGFVSATSSGFIFPLLIHKSAFKDIGLTLKFYSSFTEKNYDSDFLIIDSNFIRILYRQERAKLIDIFDKIQSRGSKIIFFDNTDSSGTEYFKLLPFVQKYIKAYTYKDKAMYGEKYYGGRLWTDYYHKNSQINDSTVYYNNPIDSKYINKIKTGYLLGLCNFSRNSINIKSLRISEIIRKLHLEGLFMKYPATDSFIAPSKMRSNDVSCRINTSYSKNSIAFQRLQISEILKKYLSHIKLDRTEYLKELSESKIVVSPFGWGEINVPRDYEVAMNGSLLLKPDFSHLATFPNIFNNDTVITFKWDLSDLLEKIDNILSNYTSYLDYAYNLQNKYKHYICTKDGHNEFCHYFKDLILN